MVKRMTQWHPREGIDETEALRYWKDEHARLVERVPGVRRYVQNRCITGPREAERPYAGLGEVWFDTLEDAERGLASPEWNAVIEDASTFMDLERVTAAWVEQQLDT